MEASKGLEDVGIFFLQEEEGIGGFCLSRGLGDVYEGQFIMWGILPHDREIMLRVMAPNDTALCVRASLTS